MNKRTECYCGELAQVDRPCPACAPPEDALDFKLAEQMTGRPVRMVLDHRVREELQSQHRLALSRVRQEERREVLEEVKAEMNRRVDTDPLTRYLQVMKWLTDQLSES